MLQVANVATSRSVSGDIVKKLLHWPTFVICLVIALAVGYGASNWFNLNFWLAFGITVMIWVVLGLIAFFEDEVPGGFNNPRPDQTRESSKKR